MISSGAAAPSRAIATMKLLARWGLGHRLALGFGLVLALLGGIAGLSLQRMHGMAETLDMVAVRGAERGQALGRLERASTQFMFTLRDLGGADLATGGALVGQARISWQAFQQGLVDVEARLPAADDKVGPLLAAVRAHADTVHELLPLGEKAAEGRGDTAAFFAMRELMAAEQDKWGARQQAWLAALVELAAWHDGVTQAASVASIAGAAEARALVIGGSLLALAVGGLTGWRITRDISRGVADAVEATTRMARHDLSLPVPVRRQDELGALAQALEGMRQAQRELAAGVRQACGDIAQASAEIAQGSMDLSSRTEQGVLTLHSAVAAIEQLGGSVDHTVRSADSASALAGEAKDVATRGGGVVAQAVQTMGEIDSASRRIADITAIIDGIAFQTNILALNAAVEAARAGEQGRGFAVVAGEVRTLAQRSATAAREIRQLIETSLQKVHAGSEQVRRAGGATDEIMASVQRVSGMIGTIASETGQQHEGLARANRSVAELDRVAQQNAALAEQSAAAAASLAEQAQRLNGLVTRFQLETSAG